MFIQKQEALQYYQKMGQKIMKKKMDQKEANLRELEN